ncbi:MAG: tRNA pseudouridine(54/55) synthase Pus10, partial [Candidatus Wukongarchaeota archaeon]|nr:tRNA pseudouridine(54/55) synthase Pus10 [Candidatus Wukongarchaeota archaeon]
RQFALLGHGVANFSRGLTILDFIVLSAHTTYMEGEKEEDREKALKILYAAFKSGSKLAGTTFEKVVGKEGDLYQKFKKDYGEVCWLCEGLFSRLESLALKVVKAGKKVEFETFLIGCVVNPLLIEREDCLRAEYGLVWGESLKSELNREVGKIVSKLAGKGVDFNRPDVVFLMDLVSDVVEVKASSIFVYSRYRKLKVGVPQAPWFCKNCKGVGCDECGGSGRRYETSIAELICEPAQELAKGVGWKFHAAGREDVDALMLGSGRPFVIEVKNPKIRSVDLKLLQEKISEVGRGIIEVDSFRFSDKEEVRRLKEASSMARKTYRTIVKLENEAIEENLKVLEEQFSGVNVSQRTPTRVLHRRTDIERIKKVFSLKARKIDRFHVELLITTQGGTYVKELISGDEGRTKPSVAEVLGIKAECLELSVVSVE